MDESKMGTGNLGHFFSLNQYLGLKKLVILQRNDVIFFKFEKKSKHTIKLLVIR